MYSSMVTSMGSLFFCWTNSRAGFINGEGVVQWAQYIHLANGIVSTEHAVDISRFYGVSEI